jgi:hypothetical protein
MALPCGGSKGSMDHVSGGGPPVWRMSVPSRVVAALLCGGSEGGRESMEKEIRAGRER